MTSALKKYLNIGNNLRRIRKLHKENQTEFAQRLGLSRSTYSNYENNNRLPDDQTLVRIADLLNIKVNDLLGVDSINSQFDFAALDDIVRTYGEHAQSKGFNFDQEIKKTMKELSSEGLSLLKHAPIGLFNEYLIREFGIKYSDLLKEMSVKEKQEIYEKVKEYVDLLLKVKEKAAEVKLPQSNQE